MGKRPAFFVPGLQGVKPDLSHFEPVAASCKDCEREKAL
jgi:hypothetical protein